MFLITSLAVLFVYILHNLACLLHNRSLARKTNLPYILFPFSEANIIFLALWSTVWFPYVVNNWLSLALADLVNDSVFRGRWNVKDRMAMKYGGVYLYVTPGGISCNVADGDVVEQVCRARTSFVKPVKHMEGLNMFGPSIFTTEGSQWAQHHRSTAPAFNDKNNALVWTETMQQTRDMIQYWQQRYCEGCISKSSFVVPDAREDVLKLSLNIICSAGFGVRLPFKPTIAGTATTAKDLFQDAVTPAPGYRFTFRAVMEYMNRSMMSVFIANGILPRWVPRFLVPFFGKQFDAHRDLGNFLHALVKDAEGNQAEAHNLLERVVRSRREQNTDDKRKPGLTDAEILGNVYIFSIAGHETTATTLRFALVLLGLHCDVQEELYQELRTVLGEESPDSANWDHATVFPRLISPLCIMFETLRLYPPVASIPKLTAPSGGSLNYEGEAHHLPANVRLNLNCSALHQIDRYWGPEAGVFNPRRWDKRNRNSFLAHSDDEEGLSGPGLESHDIHKPRRGAYIPFSDGMRACIGKRFAQVEFVAALVVLFRDYRVTLARYQGESDEDAARRAKRALHNSSTSLTLALTEKVPLKFHKRDSA
ncbi:cytochrome P450 [Aspergillus stella-maris]|uniref:cytochrome P450 n=1 Tax=Aspergillus stella-maris TaxID=1810926 RepID=UPI003CCDC462